MTVRAIFIAYTSLVFLLVANPNKTSSPCHGSLVLAILSRSGLVIAADKRAINCQGTFDDDVKIHRVDPLTAVVSTGAPMCAEHTANGWRLDFDASTVLANKLANLSRPGSLKPCLPVLAEDLRQKFQTFVTTTEEGKLFPSGYPLFISRIFHYNREQKIFEVISIKLDYNSEHSNECTVTQLGDPETLTNTFCYPLGSTELLSELKHGNSPLLEGLRDEQDVIRFLIDPVAPKSVEIDEAKKAALHLIALTSQYNDLAGQGNHSVSTAADVCLICPDTGFRWIIGGNTSRICSSNVH